MGRLRFCLARGLASIILSGLCGADAFAASAPPAPVAGPATTTTSSSTRSNAVDFDFVLKGNQAFRSGNRSNAIYFFTQAIAANPTNVIAYYNRGRIRDLQGDPAGAMADFDRLLSINPNHLGTRQLRGQLHLRQGHFAQAIGDYDDYIKLAPKAEARHWQRGMAYYLAGRFEDGIRQFALCAAAMTNDLEHVLWHFACVARAKGEAKAKSMLLRAGPDPRAVLRDLHGFYDGRLSLDGLLMAGEQGKQDADGTTPEERKFLKLYYLGLYFDAIGEVAKAIDYLGKAVEIKAPDSLMIDIARVQLKARRASLKPDASAPK